MHLARKSQSLAPQEACDVILGQEEAAIVAPASPGPLAMRA